MTYIITIVIVVYFTVHATITIVTQTGPLLLRPSRASVKIIRDADIGAGTLLPYNEYAVFILYVRESYCTLLTVYLYAGETLRVYNNLQPVASY